jgi:hypothetical protein
VKRPGKYVVTSETTGRRFGTRNRVQTTARLGMSRQGTA